MGALQRKTSDKTGACLQKGSAEHGGYVGGFTSVWITETGTVALPEEDGILGQILNPYNLNKAYLKVCRNKGSHGVDGLEIESLRDYLKHHGSDLIKSIRNGKYRPNPVRRVEIPKDAHSKRPLGIPTVVDRLSNKRYIKFYHQFTSGSFRTTALVSGLNEVRIKPCSDASGIYQKDINTPSTWI